MEVTFVNHSSFITDACGVRLICDPWLEGDAFHHGWALLSETVLKYEDFKDITHIWFSHEHPDHFSPMCIKKIPVEARRNITVLYQETQDKKVVEFCKKLEFKNVIELPLGRAKEIAPGFEITCQSWAGFEDSWCLIRTPEGTILNLNDCTVDTPEEAEQIKKVVGDIDVLFTQFSISAWDGNADDLERRQAGARKMLERTVMQANIIEPRFLIPFASFVWFCHEENAYMNDAFLSIEEVAATLEEKTKAATLFLYPGDQWVVGDDHDSGAALMRYRQEQLDLATRPKTKAETVSQEKLIAAAEKFCSTLQEGSDVSKLRMHLAKESIKWRRAKTTGKLLDMVRLHVEPARIYVPDYQQSYLFDLYDGLRTASFPEEECDVVIGSESLHYSFKFLWGGESLHINGRFRETSTDSRFPLFHYFSLAGNKSAGRHITWKTLPKDIISRLAP